MKDTVLNHCLNHNSVVRLVQANVDRIAAPAQFRIAPTLHEDLAFICKYAPGSLTDVVRFIEEYGTVTTPESFQLGDVRMDPTVHAAARARPEDRRTHKSYVKDMFLVQDEDADDDKDPEVDESIEAAICFNFSKNRCTLPTLYWVRRRLRAALRNCVVMTALLPQH